MSKDMIDKYIKHMESELKKERKKMGMTYKGLAVHYKIKYANANDRLIEMGE